jgi:hypothetical protein
MEIKMSLPKTIFTKEFVNDYGTTIRASFIHRPQGWDGNADRPEAWLVRTQSISNGDPCYHGQAYKDKLEALDHYNKLG